MPPPSFQLNSPEYSERFSSVKKDKNYYNSENTNKNNNTQEFPLQIRPQFRIKKKHKINQIKISQIPYENKDIIHKNKDIIHKNFISNPTNETISSIISNLNMKVDISPRSRESKNDGLRRSPLLIEKFENSSPGENRYRKTKNYRKVSPKVN